MRVGICLLTWSNKGDEMAEEVVTGCAVAFGVKPERFGSSLGCTVAVYQKAEA